MTSPVTISQCMLDPISTSTSRGPLPSMWSAKSRSENWRILLSTSRYGLPSEWVTNVWTMKGLICRSPPDLVWIPDVITSQGHAGALLEPNAAIESCCVQLPFSFRSHFTCSDRYECWLSLSSTSLTRHLLAQLLGLYTLATVVWRITVLFASR